VFTKMLTFTTTSSKYKRESKPLFLALTP
jgi:hypothetical protein